MRERICKIGILLLFAPLFVIAQSTLVNINTANVTELDTLPGVGLIVAQRIIDGRPYASVEEISNVQGIGEPGSSTYENIINLITVGGSSGATSGATSSVAPPQSPQPSSHYSAVPESGSKPLAKLEASAGRDRTGTVGSPLEFKAEVSVAYNRNASFRWNFGDGSEGAGEVLGHTYEYPGEYLVVLNAMLPEGQAVSRVNVKIEEPKLVITLATPERIELKNNSKYETSLFGRVLAVGSHAFAFPQDTIIKAGQSVSFSSKITGLNPNGVNEVGIVVVGSTEQSKLAAKIEEKKSEKIAYLQNQIALLQKQMATISIPKPDLAVEPPSEEVNIEEPTSVEEINSQAATVKDGWFAMIKRFFLRTK